MSTTLELINKVIQKAGIDGALTDDAISYFNKVILNVKELKVEVAAHLKEIDELKELNKTYAVKNSEIEKELRAFNNREDELEEREKTMLKLELVADYEAERVRDHKEMFGVVFKNLGIRRTIYTSAQEPDGNGYSIGTSKNVDETVKTE